MKGVHQYRDIMQNTGKRGHNSQPENNHQHLMIVISGRADSKSAIDMIHNLLNYYQEVFYLYSVYALAFL